MIVPGGRTAEEEFFLHRQRQRHGGKSASDVDYRPTSYLLDDRLPALDLMLYDPHALSMASPRNALCPICTYCLRTFPASSFHFHLIT